MSSSGVCVGAPLGLQLPRIEVRAYNRTGGTVAVGEVVQFDLFSAAAETSDTSYVMGAADSGLSNLIAPDNDDVVGNAIYCVALEEVANDAVGNFCVQGVVDVKAGEAIDLGDPLFTKSDKTLIDTGGANKGVWGFAMAAIASGATGSVLFNGYGFGTQRA